MKTTPNRPEIMAPAGSFESLQAAINAGTHSIYFGVEQLNMRSKSANFGLNDLPEIARRCREAGVKSYLTLNTIVYDHDLRMVRKICETAHEAGVSAVIAMDVAAIQIAREVGLEVHLSTQVNVTNLASVKFYATFADVVVLARELTLKQIEHICAEIKRQNICGPSGRQVGIEIFVHGALCIAVSGKCGMSLATSNASANRGACVQNCRRSYKVTDNETGQELVIDNEFVMSPSDLCTLPFIDKIIHAGVSVLKIEGRGRSPDYVHAATTAYREAAEAVIDGTYSKEKVERWMESVRAVYNRGFWEGGYYMGKKISEWSQTDGSKATEEKFFVGLVQHHYTKAGVAAIEVRGESFNEGESLLITGPTTGVVKLEASSMRLDDQAIETAPRGALITLACGEKVRERDKVYALRARIAPTPSSELAAVPAP